MSDLVNAAVAALNDKMDVSDFDSTARFVIEGEGAFMVSSDGAVAEDGTAEVTLTADAETFQQIFVGELNATAAFMSGKLAIDGDMGTAMKLANVLA